MNRMITNEGISSLCLELSMLLHAGVGAGDALALLAEESDSEYKEFLTEMSEKADEGMSLSTVFKGTGRFPVYVFGMLEVGEQSGRTVEALTALSRYYEYRVRLERRIKSALLYPAMMLLLMLLVIAVLLIKVLPIFDDVYKSLGGRLTGVAGGLLVLGQWLNRIMPILWVILVAVAMFLTAFAIIEPFRAGLLSKWKKKHGDKGISRKINTSRLAQALAMGMSSGLALEEAVSLAAGLMEDVPGAAKRCMDCRERLDNGEPQGSAFRKSGLMSGRASRLLELGLKSGAGDVSMEKIARDMSEESDAAVEELVSRVEPALVMVCSILVGVILLSVMLPLMHIISAIG